MPSESRNSSQQQQQNNEGFIRSLVSSANEHSKRLTIIDTVIYVFLMVVLLVLIVIEPGLAPSMVEIISYVSTAYVALRATYGLKAGLENYQKLRSTFGDIKNGIAADDDEEAG